MRNWFQSVLDYVKRSHSLHPGVRTVQTRLAVSIAALMAACFTPAFDHERRVLWIVILYFTAIIAIAFPHSPILRKKRFRATRDLLDLLAISLIVNSTGGFESPWHLLYFFPILSQARYMEPASAIAVAAFSTICFAIASTVGVGHRAHFSSEFWVWAVAQMGVALTATNLARMRDRAEAKLVNAIERIDREILANADIGKVMLSILETAMEITDSDISAIALLHSEAVSDRYALANRSAEISPTRDKSYEQEALRFIEGYCEMVCKEVKMEWRTSVPFQLADAPKTVITPSNFVPLKSDGRLFGVLGVFSRDRLHYYSYSDVRKLLSMAPLIAMAHKNAQLYPDLVSRDLENKNRLSLLYEIGDELRAEQGLGNVLQKVVKIVSARLGSEEAALFVLDEAGLQLEKVAVSGPDQESALSLKRVERSYCKGESLTGQVLESKKGIIVNAISHEEAYAEEYSQLLPSRTTRHYIGVPLLMGEELFGVIRVINKKSSGYRPEVENASLSNEGFKQDDLDLLNLISTQIVSAIRNAKFLQERVRMDTLAALRKLAEKTAHDIKHDIAAVQAYAITLRQQAKDDFTSAACESIREAGDGALGKLQNLLMTASPVTPALQVISLKTVLHSFEAGITRRANASRVEFRATYPEDDPMVLADADQLRQVFANLFGNSIDAIRTARTSNSWKYPGTISLAMTTTGDDIMVVWSDNGCGISDDTKKNLFTALFTTKQTGSGLGLFLSKAILERHNGTIEVQPAESCGTCFRLILPVFRPTQVAADSLQSVPLEATA